MMKDMELNLNKKPHGGAREGAGRPEGSIKLEKKESITIRLTHEQREKLKALGGAKWIRQKIDETNA